MLSFGGLTPSLKDQSSSSRGRFKVLIESKSFDLGSFRGIW